jgi:alkylation response protein AidB-like acyl-CoA dehydrogenase
MNLSKKMRLFGLSISEEYGGTGIGMVGKCGIYEELGEPIMGIPPSSVPTQESALLGL